jgi:hypothetical protein
VLGKVRQLTGLLTTIDALAASCRRTEISPKKLPFDNTRRSSPLVTIVTPLDDHVGARMGVALAG